MIGPKITVHASCSECQFCGSEYYYVEDGNSEDSGFNYWCKHEAAPKVGNDCYRTPKWCPFLVEAMKKCLGASGQ